MNRIAKGLFTAFATASMLISMAATAASRNSADVLKYIPADTPYVVASTEPMPDKLADKFEPVLDELLAAYRTIIRQTMAQQLVKMAEEGEDGEGAEKVQGVVEELLGLLSLQGLRGAGIERDSAFAFYGNGLLPVVRLELSDEKLFDQAIGRIETKAGNAMSIGSVKNEAYRYFDFEVIRLIIATIDEQAIITGVPVAFDDDQIAASLGITKVAKNLKKSGVLKAIRKEYDFEDQMIGFFDFTRMASVFTGNASANDEALFAALGKPLPEFSAVCNDEIMQLVSVAPRMVMGYNEMSTKNIRSTLVVEMRDDIANGMATLPAAVPGLGLDMGGLFTLGFSMNPLALRSFYEARLDAIEEDPYECEMLAPAQDMAAQGRMALNQPIPPMVYSFRGLVANIADFDVEDFDGEGVPESLDATILFGIEDAESLLMMGAMIDPTLASLNLAADGKPVKLELPTLAAFASDVYAAMTSDAISLSTGEGAESNAASALDDDSVNPPPFMSINMDTKRYYALLAESMKQEGDEDDKTPLAMREAMSDMMTLSGELYDRMTVNVQFTERGVEIVSDAELGD